MKKDAQAEYRSTTMSEEIYLKLDKIRQEKCRDLGLPALPWNAFYALFIREYEERKAKSK